jgi:hypothetical protein
MASRQEWSEQIELAHLLNTWLPTDCFWTATDPVASSALSGAMRRMRGVKPGVPDVLIWYCGKTIALELKSRCGRCSRSQRAVRERMLRAGAEWWECRSANAAMWALREVGVTFQTITRDDGERECWQQPELAPWEVPRRDPAEPRPSTPELAARRRAEQRRWRLRQRARKAAQLAAQRDAAAGGDIAA